MANTNLSDVISYLEKELNSNTPQNNIVYQGVNLSDMIEDNNAFPLIDKMKNKYANTSDPYKFLERAKISWDQIPWQDKMMLISVCYFTDSTNKKSTYGENFMIGAIYDKTKHLLNP